MKQTKKILKNILIIGASGFFGKSLIEFLTIKSKKKYNIHTISRTKIYNNKKNSNISHINEDILEIKKLPEVDLIFYFINSKKLKEAKKIFNSFVGLLNLNNKNAKILFSSSGAVYGPPIKKKKLSETKKIDLKSFNKFKGYKKIYAKQKYYLEKQFKILGKKGYKVSIARCFSFYGKFILDYSYVISKIMNSFINRQDIIFNNSNNITRSYMHSDDLSNWLLKICENSNKNCPIYNVGSDEPIHIKKFTQKLAKKYGINVKSKKIVTTKLDYYVPSVKLAKKKLKLKISKNFKNDVSFY